MRETYYFWYSAKQSDPENSTPEGRQVAAMLREFRYLHNLPEENKSRCFVTLEIGGERVEVQYTECSQNPVYGSLWDDAVFLGTGTMADVRVEMEKTA